MSVPPPLPDLPAGLRRATDADADALVRVVGAAYDEHPGCVLDLPGVDDDLPAPGTTAGRRGSPWWVVERDGTVIASVGCGALADDGSVELKRLYLDAAARGRGLATALVGLVEAHAAGLGATSVQLWSDTRFLDAHRRYAALGYARTGESRQLHDPSDTTEYGFRKAVTPRPADATVRWTGPFGEETATLTRLPDGWRLTSSVPDRDAVVEVETDGRWWTRRAEVVVGGRRRRLTADGDGRWWRDGAEAPDLAGAADVDVELTPLTNTLPIRRLVAEGRDDAEVTAAWVRVPGDGVEPLHQRYRRVAADRWRYRSGAYEAELTVDDDGLVVAYGDRWHRR